MIAFSKAPAIGTVVLLDRQVFELVELKPHTRKDGGTMELLVWQSGCASCGTEFVTSSPLRTNGLTRRCAECRKPGKPVRGKRGRRVAVKVLEA